MTTEKYDMRALPETYSSHAKWGVFVAATLLLCACASSDPEPATPVDSGAIDITASGASMLSESRLEGSTPLSDVHKEFGVKAWKTMPDGSEQLVMGLSTNESKAYHVKFHVDDKVWYYEDVDTWQKLCYWDMSASSYVFAAVAPYSETGVAYDHEGKLSVSGVQMNGATDWMVAASKRTNGPVLVYGKDLISGDEHEGVDFAEKMHMTFHRLRCHVEFRIYGAGAECTVNSFKVETTGTPDVRKIVTKADYSGGTWTPTVTDMTTLCDSTFEPGLEVTGYSKPTSNLLYSAECIPQQFDEGLKVTINVNDNKEITTTLTLPAPEHIVDWKMNTACIYYLIFTGYEIILGDVVSVDPWATDPDVTMDEETQTNW